MDIVALFCELDDFCQHFVPWMHTQLLSTRQRQRQPTMHLSEVMTILVLFHLQGYRTFKQFYCEHVCVHLHQEFPHLVSYSRFVELQRDALLPLCAYLQRRKGRCTGISFIDATALAVCHNRRIHSHRVFAAVAARGKTSMGWFYGFKLHLVVNDEGELLACCLTPGNTDDRTPVPELVQELWGKLFADKGYISQLLFETLFDQKLQLVTKLKRKMRNKLMPLIDKILLRKRAIIETVTDQFKNISPIEHTRHRSLWNFLGNVAAWQAQLGHPTRRPGSPPARLLRLMSNSRYLILLALISLTVVGLILVGIVAVIDAILTAICELGVDDLYFFSKSSLRSTTFKCNLTQPDKQDLNAGLNHMAGEWQDVREHHKYAATSMYGGYATTTPAPVTAFNLQPGINRTAPF